MTADIHGLSGAYAVDALSEHERAEFEQHLARCRECQAEVASLRAAAAELSLLTAQTPPPALREAVLRDIRRVRPLPPEQASQAATPTARASHEAASEQSASETASEDPASGDPASGVAEPPEAAPSAPIPLHRHVSRRRLTTWLAAAAAAAVLAVGGLVWSPWDDGQPPPTAIEQVLRAQDAQRYQRTVDGARATIVRSPTLGKAVVITDNMPQAPTGMDYQLWLQRPDGTMVSAGLMPHSSQPTVSMMLEGDAGAATGAGITMEPAGGSRQPTSEPLVLVEFS